MDEEALLVIRRWIKKAEHDLATAADWRDTTPGRLTPATFPGDARRF